MNYFDLFEPNRFLTFRTKMKSLNFTTTRVKRCENVGKKYKMLSYRRETALQGAL